MSANRVLPVLILSSLLVSCSAQQLQVSMPLEKSTNGKQVFVLHNAVVVEAKKTKPTRLRAGTRWTQIGNIEQGAVFDTKDQVVIVNSFDVHEASIVVRDQTIVGYFLSVEETFVETKPIKVILIEEGVKNAQ